MRFESALPGDLNFTGANRPVLAASPDGTRFVYSASDGLYLHSLGDATHRRLVSGSPTNPAFSPGGESVAYFENGQIKRLALAGGAPVAIATTRNPFGAAWAADNAIYFASAEGIARVPADGGSPAIVINAANGEQFGSPQLLPDGDTLLFTTYKPIAATGQSDAMVAVQSLRGGERRVVVQGGANGKYVEGHLVYTVADAMFAVPFDARTHQTSGGVISLTERIRQGVAAAGVRTASFDVARNGTLFYAAAGDASAGNQMVWVARDGAVQPIASLPKGPFGTFTSPQLSKDGRRVLLVGDADLRIYDLATGRETRVTSDRTVAAMAAWVPGERAVIYSSSRAGSNGVTNVWRQRLDETAAPEQLTTLDGQVHFDAVAPDGSAMMVHHHAPRTFKTGLLVVDTPGGKPAGTREFVSSSAEGAVFSPDGRFAAYIDFVSGTGELVIRPFPGPGSLTPVSVGGAREAVWARNGELFYRRLDDDMMMAVRVATSPVLSVGSPVELFRGSGNPGGPMKATYDVTADGKRFVMSTARVQAVGRAAHRPAVSVVLNWTEQLKQRNNRAQ
jgi:Tol biopolymer transport system component